MGYFCSPVFWQIRFLVESLTKKTQQACTSEIDDIVALYGQDAELFCLSCLVKEIDLGIVGAAQGQRGDQVPADMQSKLSVLSERVSNLWRMRQSEFAICMRQILEGAAALTKEAADEAVTTGEPLAGPKEPLRSINVQQLEIICRKVLGLKSSQQLCVGLGLSASANSKVADEGARFLVSTLFESLDISDRDADVDIIAKVLWVLRNQHVFLADTELSNSCLLALQDRLPETIKKLDVAPLALSDPLCVDSLIPTCEPEDDTISLAHVVGCLGIDGVMEDLGPACTASTETLKSVLEPFCKDRGTKLADEDVAAVLAMMARTQTSFVSGTRSIAASEKALDQLQQSFAGLSTSEKRRGTSGSGSSPAASDASGWDIGILVHVAKEVSGGNIDADKVVRLLGSCTDNLSPEALDKTGFDLIVRAYKLMKGGKALPGMALLETGDGKAPGTLWENRAAQMALLFHAATAPADAVSFAAKDSRREVVSSPQGIQSSPSGAWESVDFVATLDALAGSGYYQFVKALFEHAVDRYPETLLLGLLQIKSPFDALREETYAVLLPKFLQSIQQRTQPLQPKLDTVKQVWKLNHFVLLRALVALYARDPSFLPFLVEIVRQQPDGMAKFLDLPITTLVFDAICCASRSDPQEYDLDKWLTDRTKTVLSQGQQQVRAFARNLLTFVQRKAAGQQGAGPSAGAPLAAREIDIIFGRLSVLTQEPGLLTPDFISELSKTYEACGGRHNMHGTNPGAGDKGNGSGSGLPSASAASGAAGGVEKQAMAILQALYTSNKSPAETVEALVRMKNSTNPMEQNVFNALVHCVLDKYHALDAESERNVQLTGIIFGAFIQRQLISSMALGIALRYVLEALRKPTSTPHFRFGLVALDQIKSKLSEWPQTAAQVVKIPHMRERYPDLVRELEAVLANAGGVNGSTSHSNSIAAAAAAAAVASSMPAIGGTSSVVQQVQNAIRSPVAPGPFPLRGSERTEDRYAAFSARLDELIGGAKSLSESVPPPSAEIEDRITFIINNLAQRNLADKVKEAKEVLKAEYFQWVAFYLVAKRVSTQGNYHTLYMSFLDQIGEPGLMEQVRIRTLATVRRLLGSNEIVTSTNERSVLKNLGSWLGRLTLAKNKPLLHRELNLKGLLIDGYERGWLIAVVPFAAKILDGTKGSKVFVSHNPWVMGLLRTLAELYQLAELKLNLKFEIEVLCKNLSIDLKAIQPSNILRFCRRPQLESNPDFNFKASEKPAPPPSPVLQQQQPQQQSGSQMNHGLQTQQQQHLQAQSGNRQQPQQQQQDDSKISAIPEHTEIPNLGAYVHINPGLQLFIQQPSLLRRVVPVAVDRAIREIIQPVVERSVTIACITTREMITKDFAMEPDEKKMRKAAHLMVSNLAGALALVTCKEPLRASMSSHLRSLLAPRENQQGAVDEVVQHCAIENLELGCMLIEKAATEKAMRDIDEQIEKSLTVRRESRERHNTPYFDMSVFQTGNRYPGALPDNLRPTPSLQGLGPHQLLVYESFQRTPRQPMVPPSRAAVGGSAAGPQVKPGAKQQGQSAMGPGKPPLGPAISNSQGLEKWRMHLIQINHLLQELITASPGARGAGVSQLPSDHEILARLREMRSIGQQIAPAQRDDAVRTFVQPVFKRLYEIGAGDKLVLEVHLAMLELLRDLASDAASLRKSVTEWVIYAPVEHKLNRQVTIGLIRTKLIHLADFDVYLAKLMEVGRQMSAVSFAMDIVRECILSRMVLIPEMLMTLDTLQKILVMSKQGASSGGGGGQQVPEVPGLESLLDSVRMLATEQQQQQQTSGQQQGQQQQQQQQPPSPLQQSQSATSGQSLQPGLFLRSPDPPQLRQQVAHLLHRWIQLCAMPDGAVHESVHRPYMGLLQQQGALKGNENALRFFRITTELCVESSLTQTPSSSQESAAGGRGFPSKLSYVAIDAFCKLVVLLVKYADLRERTSLLSMVLDVIAGVLCREFVVRSQNNVEAFLDQRPYFRLFLNLQQDLIEAYEVEGLPEEHEVALLATFADVYMRAIPPSKLPCFSFAWLELISHRCFMPKLLRCRDARAWELLEGLLVDLFGFLQPYLREAQLTASVRVLYKGTLRVLLVLLHDFPEFLCSFHFSLCDVIPATCIQLRNLVLSAFPRSMQLLDPFTPDLRIEALPEVQSAPSILAKYKRALEEAKLLPALDEYLAKGQPANFVSELKDKLLVQNATTHENEYNVPLVNALALHVGISVTGQLAGARAQQLNGGEVQPLLNTLQQSSSLSAISLYSQLLNDLDEEGRYHFVNALANQLRYPNSHTHFFSSVLLYLFLEARTDLIREQITRVLLERLIVHRPHPWGLLITFIELIKNPRFRFWNYSFTKCAPEIHRLFESVARSCMSASNSQSAASNTQDSASRA